MKHTKHFNHAHHMNNYAMKQRMTQEEVLQLVQKAGDKVAEAMNIITDVGKQFGINVHFDQARRSNRAANGASDNENNKKKN